MPYSARDRIVKSLRERPKSWSDLLKDTELSKAALSTNIRKLIQELVVATDIDASKRPPLTVYKINPMASSLRTAKPVYSVKEEEEEPEYQIYDLQSIGKRVLKDPKRLDQLLRLYIIKEICDQSSKTFAIIPTDDDVELGLGLSEFEEHLLKSEEDIHNFCIELITRSVKSFLESAYGIKLAENRIKEEIEKIRQEGFFDIGLKHHYGIKVTRKLARLQDKWVEKILDLHNKIEKLG